MKSEHGKFEHRFCVLNIIIASVHGRHKQIFDGAHNTYRHKSTIFVHEIFKKKNQIEKQVGAAHINRPSSLLRTINEFDVVDK